MASIFRIRLYRATPNRPLLPRSLTCCAPAQRFTFFFVGSESDGFESAVEDEEDEYEPTPVKPRATKAQASKPKGRTVTAASKPASSAGARRAAGGSRGARGKVCCANVFFFSLGACVGGREGGNTVLLVCAPRQQVLLLFLDSSSSDRGDVRQNMWKLCC